MIKSQDLLDYIIKPTLEYLGLYSDDAAYLLLGTAAQESKGGYYLHQMNGGCAIGIYQMEPNTYKSIWKDYLQYRKSLVAKLKALLPYWLSADNIEDDKSMHGNLYYATAMARIRYLWVEEALPSHKDIDAMANYWKKYYNTPKGKGTVLEFKENYHMYVLGGRINVS